MNPEGDWNGKSISVAINDTSVPTPTPTPTDTPTPVPSYELLSSKTEVDEGEEVVITLKTENVPSGAIVNYSVTHPDDVDGLSATGEFVVSESGITELKITPIEDYQTEDPETLTFTLTNSNFGGNQYEDVTVSVKINDTSSFPTYKLEASAAEIDEGTMVRITLITTNVLPGTSVNYMLQNNEDLGEKDALGTFEVKEDGTDFVELTPIEDYLLEGTETFSLELVGSTQGGEEWKGVKFEIVIEDTSVPTPTPTPTETPTPTDTPTSTDTPTGTPTPIPSYELSTSKTQVNEGDSVVVTLKTENVPVDTLVSYSVSNPDQTDVLNAIGEFKVNANGITELKFNINEDYQTESGEQIIEINLTNSNFGGEQWKNKNVSIQIVDTSQPPTYELTASAMDVDEDEPVTITLSTTNVKEGTKVTYTITNSEDLGLENADGEFVVNANGTASVTLTPKADYELEGPETFKLKLMGSDMKPVEGNWNGKEIVITINDTSVPTPTPTPTDTPTPIPSYELSTSTDKVSEGGTVTITLKTENVPSGSIVNYSVTNPDEVDNLNAIGEFIVAENGITTLEVSPTADYKIDGQK